MEENYRNVLRIIQSCLWGTDIPEVTAEDYVLMKNHVVSGLPMKILPKMRMTEKLRDEWKINILQHVSNYTKMRFTEQQLPITVPYVILKGTSAAQYYPYPEARAMGDIDLMTREEDYQATCEMLMNAAWKDITSQEDEERGRHRIYIKNSVILELHRFFSSTHDPETAETLDGMIRENIQPGKHMLPDSVNGLVLLEHILQHLKGGGLGLRQIIDWMMFVNKCLHENEWDDFELRAEKTKLKNLAITITRMCEIYLGLHENSWSATADEKLCKELMDYILACGNFGKIRDQNERIAIYRINRLRHPLQLIHELKTRDLQKKNGKPGNHFGWVKEGIQLLKNSPDYWRYYSKERQLNNMFQTLGIDQSDIRCIYYEDGKYVQRLP